MNINECVFQDYYIPCTYKLFLRNKLVRNKVTCVSFFFFFLRNEPEYTIMGLLFWELVYNNQWI